MKRAQFRMRKGFNREDAYNMPHEAQFRAKFHRLFTRRMGRRAVSPY
ncbi:MAG: hypothetical protein PHE61_05170 [Candidatus Omnitrophica bacterium]|nr:hypothetical protein [Candidatus Omnitrophota bacterium]